MIFIFMGPFMYSQPYQIVILHYRECLCVNVNICFSFFRNIDIQTYILSLFGQSVLSFISTQRQDLKLIAGRRPAAKTRLLSFNRTQSRVVTGLRTGQNTLRKHLHYTALTDSPLCRRCGAEGETSSNVLCECEGLDSLRHTYLGSFSCTRKMLTVGIIWNFSERRGLPRLGIRLWATKCQAQGLGA